MSSADFKSNNTFADQDDNEMEATTTFFGAKDKWHWQTRRQKKVRKFLVSALFENIMAAIIVGNFVLIILETDHLADEDADSPPAWIIIPSWTILVIFVFELAMRLYSERLIFFTEEWNIFDFAVITCDFFFSSMSMILGRSLPISVLRIIRLLKVARVSKLFRFFPELRLMMVGLMGAIRAMLWGTVLLFIALLVLSIVAVQVIHPLNREVEKTGAYADCDRCGRAFQSVMAATLTFSQQILAGDSWGLVTIPIIESYPITAVYFGGVYLIIGVAILNLILGVVVDVAQQARKKFEHDLEHKKLLQQKERGNHLMKICRDMDEDRSGCLTKAELFDGFAKNEAFRKTLQDMGVEKEDMEIVWICLDSDKSGSVSYNEFVTQLYSVKSSDTEFMLAYIKYYITIIKDEIFLGLDTIKHDLTEMMKQEERMIQAGEKEAVEREEKQFEKIDSLLMMSNSPKMCDADAFKYPAIKNGVFPTPSSPQIESVVADVMKEMRRNQAELRQCFVDMETKVDRSMGRYMSTPTGAAPTGAALSLWQVPAACQRITIGSSDRA